MRVTTRTFQYVHEGFTGYRGEFFYSIWGAAKTQNEKSPMRMLEFFDRVLKLENIKLLADPENKVAKREFDTNLFLIKSLRKNRRGR